MTRTGQSILDYLVEHLDGLKHFRHNKSSAVSSTAADMLFKIWRDKKNVVANRLLKRPATVSLEEINTMKKEGLIHDLGDKIEVTDKGSQVIKIMILGDDRSIFDKSSSQITFIEAKANTRARALKMSKNKEENDWWSQVLKI